MRFVSLILLVVLFAGCSSLTKEQCLKGDWQKIGFVDGKNGRSSKYINNHKRTCSVSSDEEQAYTNGRTLGLVKFCTFKGGYSLGTSGATYNQVCQDLNEQEFLTAYQKGREVYLLRKRKAEISERIAEQNKRVEEDASVLNHATQAYNLMTGRSPTETLDKEERNVSKKLYQIESALPANVSIHQIGDPQQVELMVNALGAFTGTFMGFGIGHAIQGRYAKDGWQWTLIDAASIASIGFAGANNSCRNATPDPNGNVSCSDPATLVAALGFVGLRVWQSVKLWSHLGTSQYDSNYQISLHPKGIYILGQF